MSSTPQAFISQFVHIAHTENGKELPIATFLDYVREGKWQDSVLPIRAIKDKEARQSAKKKVPYVTISGTFAGRTDNGITAHSGFIGIDLDNMEDPEIVKERLAQDQYVYAVFTSISGTGLCAIFKINGDKHREAFAGISQYLYETYRLHADPTAVNPSRARYVSFDPHLHLNESAKKFTHYPKEKEPKNEPKVIFVKTDFDAIIKNISDNRINICESYGDWLRCGFALAHQFGNAGLDYFHVISAQSSKYNSEDCDGQYKACLKGNGLKKATIDSLYYYCRQAGVETYSPTTKEVARAASTLKKSGLGKEEIIENIEKFSGISPEVSTPVVEQIFSKNIEYKSDESIFDQIEKWFKQKYAMRRNTITRYIENNDKPLKQKDFNSIYISCKKVIDPVTYEMIERLIHSDFTPEYNPIHDFFDRHKDVITTGNIEALFSTIKTSDTAFCKWFGRKWLVSIIASAYGTHSPLMLVLSGEKQGTGKTEFLRRLLPKELRQYYAESKLDAGKDDEILMTQKLLIMDDEMGGKSKKDERKLKEMLSRQHFSLREPYGRNNVDLERLAVLCGTTNDRQILNDPTGNRRIIPVHVQDIDRDAYNKVDKLELIMEAYHLYKSGFDWQLNKQDIEVLSLQSDEFQQFGLEYELIEKFYEMPKSSAYEEHYTSSEVKVEIERFTNQKLSLDRVGKEIQRLGYKQISKRVDGNPRKVWVMYRKKLDKDVLNLPFS